jgi:hypothetical protein
MAGEEASVLQLLGAGGFGFVMGWQLYFVNRYRSGVSLADLGGIAAVIGGSAVLAMFPAETDLLGAYGIGLLAGFLTYFLILVVLVARSDNFTRDWFLDGRRKAPLPGENKDGVDPTTHPMGSRVTLQR